jgi:hypothetical protein
VDNATRFDIELELLALGRTHDDDAQNPYLAKGTVMRKLVLRSVIALAIAAVAGVGANAALANNSKVSSTTFSLFPAAANLPCLQKSAHKVPTATATVTRGSLNDTLVLKLAGFKPGLDFDLFTVQNSNQTATGGPVTGFTNFGLAWYQSDVQINSKGGGTVKVETILLDQIFGFDPAVALAPTNTFHVGFWFNNPANAAACGFTGFTPFNGEHQAGPLAFITRPSATTNLGPLCTDPMKSGTTFVCNP